jgi:uncharacterized protein
MDFGIVCAVDEEFSSLAEKIKIMASTHLAGKEFLVGQYQDFDVVVVKSGIGLINAAMTTSLLLHHFDPQWLLFSGIAGALHEDLKVGHVLVASSAYQAEAMSHERLEAIWQMPALDKPADSHLLSIAESLYETCPYPIRTGVIISSDRYPAPKDYLQLVEKKPADAIDMETAGFYQVCQAFSKPGLCIRSFSNPVTNAEEEVLEGENIAISSHHAADFCYRLIEKMAEKSKQSVPSHCEKIDKVAQIIERLNLQAHPEGGYYRRTYQSSKIVGVSAADYGATARHAGTAIHYLLRRGEFSAWHRVRSDEVWNYHLGGSITLHLIDPDTQNYHQVVVGNPLLDAQATVQFTVIAGTWFAASQSLPDDFSLLGCCVSPGFEFDDFELADSHLVKQFPQHAEVIRRYLIGVSR